MMMNVDQAAPAIKEAEIEDLLEAINPPTAACGSNGVRVATWSSQRGIDKGIGEAETTKNLA
jgi:hypothetical protein